VLYGAWENNVDTVYTALSTALAGESVHYGDHGKIPRMVAMLPEMAFFYEECHYSSLPSAIINPHFDLIDLNIIPHSPLPLIQTQGCRNH
jgi:hypothetical protein